MKHLLSGFSALPVLLFLTMIDVAHADYSYTPPLPTMGENSLYTVTEISKEEYDELLGHDEVFADAFVAEKDTVQYHYYQYAAKTGIISSPSMTSGNGGKDVLGGWYAQFGSFDGRAINLRGGSIGNIRADFVNNAVNGSGGYGGAIYIENGTILSLTGDFINNHVNGKSGNAYGGAIYNNAGGNIVNGINGNFINNYVNGNRYVLGGAITNGGQISSVTGKFIGNYVSSGNATGVGGGAIYNSNMNGGPEIIIDNIAADFIYNHVISGITTGGGAITNSGSHGRNVTINRLSGNFIGNYVQTESGATGGAILNYSIMGPIGGNFIGNYAQTSSSSQYAFGGAVFTDKDLQFENRGEDYFFSNNYTFDSRGTIYNAIFLNTAGGGKTVSFRVTENGSYVINDSISGAVISNSTISSYANRYNVEFTSADKTGSIFLGDNIVNADISLNGITMNLVSYNHDNGTVTHGGFGNDDTARSSLALNNSVLGLHNNRFDNLQLKNYAASGSAFLHLNVGRENGVWKADMLDIEGNIEGHTDIIVYSLSAANNLNAQVVFARAPNDTINNENAFSIYRVYGSPYMWTAARNPNGETTGSTWYLLGNRQNNENTELPSAPTAPEFIPSQKPQPEVPEENPTDPEPPAEDPDINIPTAPVYGEVVAYGALPAAALEQTRNMVDNIGNQIKNNRYYCEGCSFVDGYWNGEPYYNLWLNPTYYTSNIDSPFAIDADIWGIEAGGDIQRDVHNRLGVFFSYRQGEYDMNGDGDRYYSTVGSEIDIDSYIAGLYYRYDHNNWYAFATLYGGIQEADIKTDDGMKSDTDGVEFGASVEAGYDYALTDSVTLTPELGVFYTQVNYDDAEDNVGKSASYDDARQIELEAGVKLAKTFMTDESFANVYVKPSVVQTIVDGDEVNITGLGDVEALDDATLGRIEIGGRYGFTTNLSAYGWANYTFGSDYDATTFGLGLNYAF